MFLFIHYTSAQAFSSANLQIVPGNNRLTSFFFFFYCDASVLVLVTPPGISDKHLLVCTAKRKLMSVVVEK